MKCALITILVVAAFAVGALGAGLFNSMPNNYVFGTQGTGDVLLARVLVTQSKRIGRVVTQTYTFTQTSTTPSTITSIVITDQRSRRGATAAITAGGVGGTTVTLTFTSVRGADIRSQVDIYGTAPITTTPTTTTTVAAG